MFSHSRLIADCPACVSPFGPLAVRSLKVLQDHRSAAVRHTEFEIEHDHDDLDRDTLSRGSSTTTSTGSDLMRFNN
jgi:hypothetical protein